MYYDKITIIMAQLSKLEGSELVEFATKTHNDVKEYFKTSIVPAQQDIKSKSSDDPLNIKGLVITPKRKIKMSMGMTSKDNYKDMSDSEIRLYTGLTVFVHMNIMESTNLGLSYKDYHKLIDKWITDFKNIYREHFYVEAC